MISNEKFRIHVALETKFPQRSLNELLPMIWLILNLFSNNFIRKFWNNEIS